MSVRPLRGRFSEWPLRSLRSLRWFFVTKQKNLLWSCRINPIQVCHECAVMCCGCFEDQPKVDFQFLLVSLHILWRSFVCMKSRVSNLSSCNRYKALVFWEFQRPLSSAFLKFPACIPFRSASQCIKWRQHCNLIRRLPWTEQNGAGIRENMLAYACRCAQKMVRGHDKILYYCVIYVTNSDNDIKKKAKIDGRCCPSKPLALISMQLLSSAQPHNRFCSQSHPWAKKKLSSMRKDKKARSRPTIE